MDEQSTQKIILALSPTTRGIGFSLFEGPQKPIDWGIKEARIRKNARCLAKVSELIAFYEPDAIVVEDHTDESSRRSRRVKQLIQSVLDLAEKKHIAVRVFSRSMVHAAFSQFGAHTKYDIAKAIATWLPEFEERLPRYRKPWMTEDYRMGIFDAIALALTYYYVEE